jgi:hypothetical protein
MLLIQTNLARQPVFCLLMSDTPLGVRNFLLGGQLMVLPLRVIWFDGVMVLDHASEASTISALRPLRPGPERM